MTTAAMAVLFHVLVQLVHPMRGRLDLTDDFDIVDHAYLVTSCSTVSQ